MFFPEKIKSIKATDRVLEVGPGSNPFPRSDVLLEKRFIDEKERILQRGNVLKELNTQKEVFYYDGGRFPFVDKEFDYVVCSHVLEHVEASEVGLFLSELSRVAHRGYIEFPTIYYEFFLNFDCHKTLLFWDQSKIVFLAKSQTSIKDFKPIQELFGYFISRGSTEFVDQYRTIMVQGFEWCGEIRSREAGNLYELCFKNNDFHLLKIENIERGIGEDFFKLTKKIKGKIRDKFRLLFKSRFQKEIDRWFHDQGDLSLRLNYDLKETSVVFDIGGYQGAFANSIYDRYESNIYIFEPVKSYYEHLTKEFNGKSKIRIFNFGLSNKNYSTEITVSADGSSTFRKSSDVETVNLCSFRDFILAENIQHIDLMKINIEGGEYDLLNSIIQEGYQAKIKNIQVQFHEFIEGAKIKRDKIRKELSKTHVLTYDYYFVWENWELKK